MILPISSMLCYAESNTRYLPTLCIQPRAVLPFPFVGHTVCIYYIRQAPFEAFHDFVSTICSSMAITGVVFLGVRFCLSHKLQLSPYFWNISLCICLSRHSSFRCPRHLSLTLSLLLSMLVSNLFQSFLHPIRFNFLQNLLRSPLHALM